jgi:ABC-type transport system involved in multi-copper enzyme maturation permease subunit
MKLILTLVKNEYIKLFRRKSVPILLLILILFVFGISLIKPTEFNSYSDSYREKGVEGFKLLKDELKSELKNHEANSFSNGNEVVDAVIKEFYEKQIELCDKAVNLNLTDSSDWRYATIQELLNTHFMQYLAEYASGDGEHAEQVKEYLKDNSYYIGDRYGYYFSYSANYKAIEESNYSESKRDAYNKVINDVDAHKVKLKELESKKDDGSDVDNIDFEIYKINGKISNGEKLLRAYKIMLDKKFEYKSIQDDIFNKTIYALYTAVSGYESFLTKEQYEKNLAENNYYNESPYVTYYYNDAPQSYEKYYENTKENIASSENKGLVGLYSLENDVIEMTVANSSRNKSLSYVNLFWLIAPLAIFFTSGMVSKEFSTKTINLLLIRPVKRWKILLSKYICIITLTFGMVVVCGAVYLLGTGLSYGFEDFSQPYIYVSSGIANAVGFSSWFVWKVLIASIPVFCLVNLTFMFSSVTKGTAVSLILGVLSLFSSILILFFTGLIKNPDVLTYLPFPYFSMWSYVFDDVVTLSYSTINIFSEVIKANLTYGVFVLAGLIILSVVLAFADFTKKDIK